MFYNIFAEKFFTKKLIHYITILKGMHKMKKTVCELFAGVGGFRVRIRKF